MDPERIHAAADADRAVKPGAAGVRDYYEHPNGG
jgi:hypothetical protein